ncbi:hypothetical protein BGW38_007668 [Lunasporangiospora selenospora]|uniref:PAS domain-containing protein n=1 Tax=Lunasporangiospora selenospora TaxID=979761 RepID=A0A9P6FLG8_9FUNG|nr:hypothetical protein BGW38_007668 [Lunasporangiospora selenospora]
MILNRFTRNLSIMYASPSCEMIFGVDPELIVGKPFLLFIRADDLCSFVEQSDLAKSSNVVTHMRFWFQSPSIRHEIPCEAMLFGAADGMIAILRRCKPFIRKRLITMGQGLDLDSYSRSRSRSRSRPGYSSSRSNSQHNSNGGYTMTPPKAVSYIDSIPISPSSYKSCTSGASSYSSSSTTQGHRSYHAPLRGLPIGSINAIRNLDQECDRHRPLTSLYRDESNNCGGSSPQPDVLLRQHRVQELDGNDIEEDEDDQYEELEEDEGNVNDMDGIEMLPSREMTAELEYGIDMIHLGRR